MKEQVDNLLRFRTEEVIEILDIRLCTNQKSVVGEIILASNPFMKLRVKGMLEKEGFSIKKKGI